VEPNQRGLVAHDIRHHKKTIQKYTLERTKEWWILSWNHDAWPLPSPSNVYEWKNSVQGSLFIVWCYLGIKKRKMGFFHQSSLENKQKAVFTRIWAPGATHRGAWGSKKCCPRCRGAYGNPLGTISCVFVPLLIVLPS